MSAFFNTKASLPEQASRNLQHFVFFIDPEGDDFVTLVHMAGLIRKNHFQADEYHISLVCEFEEERERVKKMMLELCDEGVKVECYPGSSERRSEQKGMAVEHFADIEKKINETDHTIIIAISPAFDFLIFGLRLDALQQYHKIAIYMYWEYNLEIVAHTLRNKKSSKINEINALTPDTIEGINDSLRQFGRCQHFILCDRERSLSSPEVLNRDVTFNKENGGNLFAVKNESEFSPYIKEKVIRWSKHIAPRIIKKIKDYFLETHKIELCLSLAGRDIQQEEEKTILEELKQDIALIEEAYKKLDDMTKKTLSGREHKFDSKLATIKSIHQYAFQQMPLADPIISAYLDPESLDLFKLDSPDTFYLSREGMLTEARSSQEGFQAQFISFKNNNDMVANMVRLAAVVNTGYMRGIAIQFDFRESVAQDQPSTKTLARR